MSATIPAEFDNAAMMTADQAFIEAAQAGVAPAKMAEAAVRGYLFALTHREPFGDGWTYPSLHALREAMPEWGVL